MADITKIKLPSGDTYNIKDGTSGYIKTETDPTVPSWAKQPSKPTYTATEVGASPTGHTHSTTLETSTGTSTITLSSAGKYKLSSGGTNVIFTMPTIPTVSYPVTSVNGETGAVTLDAADVGASATGHTHGKADITDFPTSMPASDVYSWAKASSKPSYTYSEVGAAASGHTHAIGITGDTGTSSLDMAANTKYKITAGGSTFIFKTPADSAPVTSVNNKTGAVSLSYSDVGAASSGHNHSGTYSPVGHTHATTLAEGASGDTSTITLASAGKYKLTTGGTNVVFTMPTIPTVNYPVTSVNTKTGAVTLTASDVGASATGHTHATSIATSTGTSQIDLAANSKYQLSAGGTTYIFKTPANPDYSNTYAPKGHTHSVSITPSTTSVYSITGVGTANVPTKIDTTKFNGGSFTRGTFSGGSGSFTQGSFSGGSGSFTQGSFSGGSLTMSINGTDSKQLDITFTAATHGADSHTHVAATHGADSHTHTAATHAADSFTAASLGTGFYTAGTASTVPTRSQVSSLWNGYTAASAT